MSKTKCMIFYNQGKVFTLPQISMNNSPIEFVKTFKFLGFVLDEKLSWKSHCDYIFSKISSANAMLCRMKHFLPIGIKVNIYNALILSYLSSGLLLWGQTCCSSNSSILGAQKRAVRNILCASYNAHADPLFKQLGILKINDLYLIAMVKFYNSYKFGVLPKYFQNLPFIPNSSHHSYPTSRMNRIHLIRCHPKSLNSQIPKVFDSLPTHVCQRLLHPTALYSIDSYKKLLKSHFLSQYCDATTVCYDKFCYSCKRQQIGS